ncbi:MAG: hypothetical protein NTW58_01850 [Actinobacteria bacterium]|nr:hypothetical protein [Actinomycetota bacterium]
MTTGKLGPLGNRSPGVLVGLARGPGSGEGVLSGVAVATAA